MARPPPPPALFTDEPVIEEVAPVPPVQLVAPAPVAPPPLAP